MPTSDGERPGKSTAASNPARPSSLPIPASRKRTATAGDGYRATIYAIASGADPEKANTARAAVNANLSLLTPEQDARILSEAGFRDVEMFYAAFTWRGWIGYA